MEYRILGHTGLRVSTLGFGCGSMGGLLVRGAYPQMRQTVARAIELGINYFDTASSYGDGQSEANLGAVLRELGSDVLVGTKARVLPHELNDIENAIIRSVEGSLRRLGRDAVDLLQFHNRFGPARRDDYVTVSDLEPVLNAFHKLQQQGKTRFYGITALGDTDALHQIVAGGGFHTAQICYNALNFTAGEPPSPNFPFQDYRRLIDRAAEAQTGVIAIRMLAGGALSGVLPRHPVASPLVDPIATAPDYAADVARAQRLAFVVHEGVCDSLVEVAIRFTLSKPAVSTALIGISSIEQLEQAVSYAERGPLPADVLARMARVWAS
ncbi:MAG: aldo/keto reductase [Chloroflexi bacterium]|nr:aldo/keto reductase [Chloroflexota bacterium]